MRQPEVTPVFPQQIVFQDVDAATLAREEAMLNPARAFVGGTGAWHEYVRKVLPPLAVRRVVCSMRA